MLSKHLQKWMWVTYVTKCYICNTDLVCYIHNTGMTCPTRCYKKIRWYICNMHTYVTNKLRQRDYQKKHFIYRTIVKSKKSYLSHSYSIFCILWSPSWNMCSMTCPTRCYKEIHCYICNVRTDVTNKVQRKRLPEKIF